MRCQAILAPLMLARRMMNGAGERRSASMGRHRLLWILITLLIPASLHAQGPSASLCVPCHTLERFQVNRGVVCRQTDIAPGSIYCRHRPSAAHRKVEASCCLEHATRQLPDHCDRGSQSAVGAHFGKKSDVHARAALPCRCPAEPGCFCGSCA